MQRKISLESFEGEFLVCEKRMKWDNKEQGRVNIATLRQFPIHFATPLRRDDLPKIIDIEIFKFEIQIRLSVIPQSRLRGLRLPPWFHPI